MDIAPVSRAAVSDAVFAHLVDEILSGRVAVDEALPSERELALAFAVNRHAIREALKRLQQARLVRISHGGKTRVQDWRQTAGLDVLSTLAATGAVPALQIARDIMVMRRSVAADAARLCALNATEGELAAIATAAAAYPSERTDESIAVDLTFWTAIIDGSGNLAYRLALNTLVAAFADIGFGVIAELGTSAELADRDAHITLAEHLVARDADAAHRLADELLGRVVEILSARQL
ncbi:FadR/GntR family transcriptional regulator [Mycolicibacterium aubagnense]|uniref:GntR family transcriptional regulator n=1 Tax=Mycolicibacterium aubagnense TaxID=319707 RepID=A0ABN5YZQ6_9MYCO|nr:GntR family transcriptional regulator [Mycolicibacterium aubagnense]TLH65861.1 GntR family transcriptional regulator [Mycolicibacterium aubagnense]WGI31241.1 GntR family transcriptional regulator [Mycolicibacterium aubagnense]BBX87355.1 GntR family transcriptional regulator [Mycolicibacterium aubagnense]